MAKRKIRVSGTALKSPEGLKYAVEGENGWQIDVDGIGARVRAYLGEAAETGKYSIAGLCIALGVTRNVLALWREGYACRADAGDANVAANEALSACVEMALLHIQRHWEECDKPSSMNVKQLEATGALGESGEKGLMPPFDLGRLKKYAR